MPLSVWTSGHHVFTSEGGECVILRGESISQCRGITTVLSGHERRDCDGKDVLKLHDDCSMAGCLPVKCD